MNPSTSFIQRFLLEDLDIRGALVRLTDAWQAMQAGRDYPPEVRTVLGQMSAVSAMIAGNLKQAGRLTFQLQGHGPLGLMVVDCSEALNIRGYAKTRSAIESTSLTELVGDGTLLLTLDIDGLEQPYQSYVPIEGDSIGEMFEHYLAQSEQAPSQLFLYADATAACCLFLQKLPAADERDPDGWNRITRLAATVREDELRELDSAEMLTRLFNEESVRLFNARPVTHHWPPDCDKIRAMLRSLGRAELEAILAEQGEVRVHDDLSNHDYRLDAADVARLFEDDERPTLH